MSRCIVIINFIIKKERGGDRCYEVSFHEETEGRSCEGSDEMEAYES